MIDYKRDKFAWYLDGDHDVLPSANMHSMFVHMFVQVVWTSKLDINSIYARDGMNEYNWLPHSPGNHHKAVSKTSLTVHVVVDVVCLMETSSYEVCPSVCLSVESP